MQWIDRRWIPRDADECRQLPPDQEHSFCSNFFCIIRTHLIYLNPFSDKQLFVYWKIYIDYCGYSVILFSSWEITKMKKSKIDELL